jgi:hypothetical protein
MSVMRDESAPAARAISTALMSIAAFCFAVTLFLIVAKLTKALPATAPVAVGRVTVDEASKLRDYAGAAIAFVLIPLLTIGFANGANRYRQRIEKRARRDASWPSAFASVPFVMSPFFFLTTRKELWGVLLPIALGAFVLEGWSYASTHQWVRILFARELRIFHAIAIAGGASWILARYLFSGQRIAHIPTLFLEIVFVIFFLALFLATLLLISLLFSNREITTARVTFPRVACAFLPLLTLPILALFPVRGDIASLTVLLISVAILFRRSAPPSAARLHALLALLAIPLLLFVFSYASVAQLSHWVDLFHRGETLGPASDYLRGDAPYIDVFVLHGWLEDGQLDAWLMTIFGRRPEVAAHRAEVLSSLMAAALYLLGYAATRSIPLSLAVVALGFFTAADNQRGLFEIIVIALILLSLRRRSDAAAFASGAVCAITIFFSLEIGLYSTAGSVASLLLLGGARLLLFWGAGLAIAATPFLLLLASRGAVGAFLETSFLTIPRIIDATWSLPFPDLASRFRGDLTLRTFVDFFLGESFRFVLNPLVITIALTLIVLRVLRGRGSSGLFRSLRATDPAFVAITIFAVVTQRSALGRADFPHQYFSAFLISPLAVMLLRDLWRNGTRLWTERVESRGFLALATAIALPLLLFVFWIPDLLNARLENVITYRERLQTVGWSDERGREVAERVGAIQHEIQRMLRPGEPIFDFSNQPAIYFYANRPNPTRFFQIPILSPRELQKEAIEDLESAKPRLVTRRSPEGYDAFDGISNDDRAAAVSSYIDEHYQYAKSVRGIELWMRRPDPVRFDLRRHLAAIVPPSRVEVLQTRRIVFPAIGSVRGASGNEWRSELVIHNASDVSQKVSMRYLIPNRESREAEITVPPFRTVSFSDAAVQLFRAPQSRGQLVVEIPINASLTLRLRTFDASKAGESTLESPLDTEDAAVAGQHRLMILGARGGWPRRVNLGIVNAAAQPSRVRITMRTDRGEIVGVPVERAVEEGGSDLIVDAESAIGAPVRPNMPIFVDVIDGAVWAYASTIDGEAGHQQILYAAKVPRP